MLVLCLKIDNKSYGIGGGYCLKFSKSKFSKNGCLIIAEKSFSYSIVPHPNLLSGSKQSNLSIRSFAAWSILSGKLIFLYRISSKT